MASDNCKDIILVGKTGNGKSSLGNSLLNRKAFLVDDNTYYSVTQKCEKMANNNICVTDTPGLCDTEHHVADIALKILLSLNECPNPHAFILVFSARARMSNDELRTIKMLRLIFTQTCLERTIIVFTGYSDMKTDKDFENFWSRNPSMQEFSEACGGRVARIDNNASDSEKSKRVKEIIALVDQVSGNGTSRFDSFFKKLHEKVLNTQRSNQSKFRNSGDQDRIQTFDKEVLQIAQAIAHEYQSVWQKEENWNKKEIIGKVLFGLGCVVAGYITVKSTGLLRLLPNELSDSEEVPINVLLQILQECQGQTVSSTENNLTNCIRALLHAIVLYTIV